MILWVCWIGVANSFIRISGRYKCVLNGGKCLQVGKMSNCLFASNSTSLFSPNGNAESLESTTSVNDMETEHCDYESHQSDLNYESVFDQETTNERFKNNANEAVVNHLVKKPKFEVGSLFNCTVNVPNDDIKSPFFDPRKFDTDKYISAADNLKGSFKFKFMAEILDSIEDLHYSGTGSRKFVFTILTNFFRVLIYYKPTDLIPSVYILQNKLSPDYQNIQLGVGEALIIKAMSKAYSRSEKNLKAELQKVEDLGLVAEASTCTFTTLVKPPDLTIMQTFLKFRDIANCHGKNSQQSKLDIIGRILISGKKSESKYIIRFLQQKLRVGVSIPTIIQCLADAFYLTRPNNDNLISDIRTSNLCLESEDTIESLEQVLKDIYSVVPNVEIIVDKLLKGYLGKQLLESCGITPGIPVQPMLARPMGGPQQAFDKMKGVEFTCEYKYDGERAQVHMSEDGVFHVFSRNMENATEKYPDLIKIIKSSVDPSVKSFIIDSEVVAFDREKGKILPFQILTTRKRKDVDENNINVNICIYPFDMLYLNGHSITRKNLKERREFLYSSFREKFGEITFAKYKDIETVNELQEFLNESIANNSEGLIAKTLVENASYEPSKRSLNWLKIKKDYVEGMSDSVDLIPIAAFYGSGKRTSIFGSYLLAVYNEEYETFQTVCKTGTGFTDELLKSLHETMKNFIVSNKPVYYQVSDKMEPDIWFEPKKVWECKVSDFSLSPVHTASIGTIESDKGIGMRFPRFVRVREDKEIYQASKSSDIVYFYNQQVNKV
ncbi:DNA ligase 1 [Babesia microti strain RI]|uniref:DNA ligase n=1 Tax=Babesia microti (strain RI) TaxID=1133968 RepID=A0A1N6LWN7_BABMR|nr:DNA ligase 1 [Babesia microti strain RI]SIO73282.1 DNA ligase 1 [Babesia microti strain RI]|eukprot:XP_021337386.1 DNA ligase 1 [Babesia microti strain RI]